MVSTLPNSTTQLKIPGSRDLNSNRINSSQAIHRRTMLVVEDDQPTASVIVTVLQTSGFSVNRISDDGDIVAYLPRNPVDIVLLDLSHPSAGSLNLLAALHEAQPDLPVIAIFSRGEPAPVVEAFALGLADYVTHPLDLNDLIFRLRVMLARKDEVTWSVMQQPAITVHSVLGSATSLTDHPAALDTVTTPPAPPTPQTALVNRVASVPVPRAALEIDCLGHFRIAVHGRLVCDDNTGGRRAMELLKYLIFNLGRRVRKERVVDLLWPDLPGDLASNNLRGTIHGLRQMLVTAALDPNQFIRSERGYIYFDPGDDYYYDVQEFTRLLDQASVADHAGDFGTAISLYEQAGRVYQGQYLELDEATEWVVYEQGSLRERLMSALIRLADLYIETERYEQAITIAQRVVREDWRREAAHRILMVAFYKSGRRNQALIAYQNVVDTFKENLGIAPMQQTRDLAARILREDSMLQGSAHSAYKSSGVSPRLSAEVLSPMKIGNSTSRARRFRPVWWQLVIAGLLLTAGVYLGWLGLSLKGAEDKMYRPLPARPSVAAPIPAEGAVTTPDRSAGTDSSKLKRFNILLMVIDQPPTSPANRSDTLILISIDPVSKTIAWLSIPGNMAVEIPGYGLDKINSSYLFGEYYKEPGGGPGLTVATVEKLFRVPIKYYVTVNFRGFQKVIDAIGGVDIDVSYAIVKHQFPTADNHPLVTHFNVGMQHMDGARVLEYMQPLDADIDFAIVARQQQVIIALRAKVLQLNLLPALPNLISSVGDTVQTNLNFDDQVGLVQMLSSADSSRVISCAITSQMLVPYTDPKLHDSFKLNWTAARGELTCLFGDDYVIPA